MSSEPGVKHGSSAVRRGRFVFLVLAVLTAVEYLIAIEVGPNLPILIGIAVYKAGLILWYFMHVARAWRGEEESA
ncbi:MAG TPA: cytochrome C oxidase subunit IV family protein [Dehalococcoidia bacterium]|jgi:caa(3)-type oxidase subunit IV|nr:cytochrome C oxidase subunit IV family protein [Dehalococcoidia bacterium]